MGGCGATEEELWLVLKGSGRELQSGNKKR